VFGASQTRFVGTVSNIFRPAKTQYLQVIVRNRLVMVYA
jgi:hypothetical protein